MALLGGTAYRRELANRVADIIAAQIRAAQSRRFRPADVELQVGVNDAKTHGEATVDVRVTWPEAFVHRFSRHVTPQHGWQAVVEVTVRFKLGTRNGAAGLVPGKTLRGLGPMLVNAMFPTDQLRIHDDGVEVVADTPEVHRAVAAGRDTLLLHPLQQAATRLVLCLRRVRSGLPLELERHVLSFALCRLRLGPETPHDGWLRGTITFKAENHWDIRVPIHDWLQQPYRGMIVYSE